MLVAGSVLALLLAGLTVDGLFNFEEEDDDTNGGSGNGASGDDGQTSIMPIDEILTSEDPPEDAEDISLQSRAAVLGYLPLDQVDPLDIDPSADTVAEDLATEDPVISEALHSDAGSSGDTLLDVTATITLDDGSEVPFIKDFSAETDVIVMDFDGAEKDTPIITLGTSDETSDVVINANGTPITLVQDAPDLTEDNITIRMTDPALLETDEALVANLLPADLEDVPAIDPIVDVVETIDDGIPEADVLDSLLDDLGAALSDVGDADDMLDARGDIDPAFGTGGIDAITGTFENDALSGGDGQDALFGDDGNDTLSGGAGNDELHGDFGDDSLQGGDGIDFLDAGEGNDVLDGGAGRDALFGGDGDDMLYGGGDDDMLHGGAGADTLNGGSGNDVLNGTFGDGAGDDDSGDILIGGSGDDAILLGSGDMAQGGSGADTFTGGDHIDDPWGAGIVSDFDPSEDRIEVIYDPDLTPNPVIEVQDFSDGSGADIVLNGQVILSVSGAQGLDPALIDLRATA